MFSKNIKAFVMVIIFTIIGFGAMAFNPPNDKLPCLNKRFSIIAHIVLDSLGNPNITEQDIQVGIDSMNSYFSPICVSFEICEFRYINNFEYDTLDGIEGYEWDELLVTYHEKNRINMFFVTSFNDPDHCGFATFDGITDLETGGICILKECDIELFKTIPHEMGHYFGLQHTWEGSGVELVDGSNCLVQGDSICDTPADPFHLGEEMGFWVDGCRFINSVIVDTNGDYYDPIVGNIMSYYPSSCACGFTHDQLEKMAETYNSSNPKMW